MTAPACTQYAHGSAPPKLLPFGGNVSGFPERDSSLPQLQAGVNKSLLNPKGTPARAPIIAKRNVIDCN